MPSSLYWLYSLYWSYFWPWRSMPVITMMATLSDYIPKTAYLILLNTFWSCFILVISLTHHPLTLFCRIPPGTIRKIEGFATHISWIIFGMPPANEKWCHIVTLSFIHKAHMQNGPCICLTREMRAVFHDTYMRHLAKIGSFFGNPCDLFIHIIKGY